MFRADSEASEFATYEFDSDESDDDDDDGMFGVATSVIFGAGSNSAQDASMDSALSAPSASVSMTASAVDHSCSDTTVDIAPSFSRTPDVESYLIAHSAWLQSEA